jgi:hypothetical protein
MRATSATPFAILTAAFVATCVGEKPTQFACDEQLACPTGYCCGAAGFCVADGDPGCVSPADGGGSDAGSEERDGGIDAGPIETDAGPDAGTSQHDAGAAVDAGREDRDGGVDGGPIETDAGPDAGISQHDAGEAVDAGAETDAGEPADAGRDAGQPEDAGLDAGVLPDAGLSACMMTQTCKCGPQTTCAGPACIPARRVFVSQAMTNGNLGGIAGADALCNSYATAAQLGGTWKAFIGDSTTAPATWTAPPATVPFALIDGTIVAADWGALLSGTLQHGIDEDECQTSVGEFSEVWTGLSSPSNTTGTGCNDFMSAANTAPYADVGLTGRTDSSWCDVYLDYCDRTNVRLYCIEQ